MKSDRELQRDIMSELGGQPSLDATHTSRGHGRTTLCVSVGLAALLFACRRAPGDAAPSAAGPPPAAEVIPASQRPLPPPPSEAARDLEHAFEHASQAIAPSVVSINSVRTVRRRGGDPFFGLFPPGPSPEGELRAQGVGSGVIVSDDGHILTNSHVVHGADEIEVTLPDDRALDGRVVGTDPHTDIAVVKVAAEGLTPARLGDSDALKVGQWVLAAGSPFGLERTISAGIVSAVGRTDMGITDYEHFIQTDAAINPGNSGGPLIDLQGRVVGINTAIASRSGGNTGVGFAVPINMARQVMDQIIRGGAVVRGWLGVAIGPLDPDLARTFGYEGSGGVLVQDVLTGGPASEADLRPGDIIVELDGKPVTSASAFRTTIAQSAPETRVALKVWRAGGMHDVTATLGKLPDPHDHGATAPPRLGLELGDLSESLRRRLGVEAEQGVVVLRVQPGSPAAAAGLRPGDIIEQVGEEPVGTAVAAAQRLSAADLDKGVRLRVRRGDQGRYVLLRARPR